MSLPAGSSPSPSPAASPSSSSLQLPATSTQQSPSPSKYHHQQELTRDHSPAPPPPKKRRLFHRELKYMMHGFGDDANPFEETVELVEDLVVDFISEMTVKAMEIGKGGKVHVNDILFLIRKDSKKYARVRDLLQMNEELKKARKAFDDAENI